jgi:hypothetical protein
MHAPTVGLPGRVAFVAVTVALFSACLGPGESRSELTLRYTGSPTFPVGLLQVEGGVGEVALRAPAGAAAEPSYLFAVVSIPARTAWPLRVALISAGGDTLAVVRNEVSLPASYRVFVSVLVRANLDGGFICSSILGRDALRGGGPAPATLYVFGLQLPPEEQPPVC